MITSKSILALTERFLVNLLYLKNEDPIKEKLRCIWVAKTITEQENFCSK